MVVLYGCDVLPIVVASAIFRIFGNGYKLIQTLGGTRMETLETKFKSHIDLHFVMETLLLVGNLGASIADQRLRAE